MRSPVMKALYSIIQNTLSDWQGQRETAITALASLHALCSSSVNNWHIGPNIPAKSLKMVHSVVNRHYP